MIRAPRFTHHTPSPLALARSVAWLLRWTLVLLLVTDQIGSPLHRHHHDAGVDGSFFSGQQHGSAPTVHHVEDDDHQPSVFHAITAMRVESRLSAPGAADLSDAFTLLLLAALILPRLDLDPRVRWFPTGTQAPPPPLHRSLPPAGRAPPRRA